MRAERIPETKLSVKHSTEHHFSSVQRHLIPLHHSPSIQCSHSDLPLFLLGLFLISLLPSSPTKQSGTKCLHYMRKFMANVTSPTSCKVAKTL